MENNRSKRQYIICEICKQEFTIQNIEKHKKACNGKPKLRYKKLMNDVKRKDGYFCRYCTASGFKRLTDLKKHYKTCTIRNSLPKDSLGRISVVGAEKLRKVWDPGSFICKFCGRASKSYHGNSQHQKYCELNPNKEICKGHPCSDLNRIHQAELLKNRLNVTELKVNFNKDACQYFDNLNKEKNWNLQHALNGGEIKIGPYHLDAYDKELNIVVEYNEKFHYGKASRIERDKKRAKFIHEKLGCQLYVYNEPEKVLEKWY